MYRLEAYRRVMQCKASVMLLAGLVASVAIAPAMGAERPSYWVDISLATTNSDRGITMVDGVGDGLTAPVNVGGRDARNLVTNGSGGKYLYLDVDNAYYAGDGPGVTVLVSYYGANNVDFHIEYDAADGNPNKASSSRNTGSSNTWQKARFWLPDPRFDGNENGGADLRIATSNDATDLYIEFVALARPIGPYVEGDIDGDFTGETFSSSEKAVGVSFFYWHDAYYPDGRFLNADGTDALTAHPALTPGVPSCEYINTTGSPVRSNDYSWRDSDWHRRQINDLMASELDFIVPVYWGGTEQLFWAAGGLQRLVETLDQMTLEGHNPPKVGMFFDTSTLQVADPIFGTGTKTDLTTEDGRNFFYKQVIDFFSIIPPKYWARIDGDPILVTYAAAFASAWDQQLFDDLDTRFAEAFGGQTPYVIREVSWTGVTTSSRYAWGAALGGPTILEVASVGPGFDNTQVPPVGPKFFRDRNGGTTYTNDWNSVISTFSGNLVLVETWSEWYEATSIADAQEWGRQYIDLTQEYAARFEGNWGGTDNAIVIDNTIPSTQYAGESTLVTVTVKNTGSSNWSEGNLIRLGAVDDSDPFIGSNRIALPGATTVAPGETYTFEFTMTAPNTPGTYTTDWQMVNDGSTWFGELHLENVEVVSGLPSCPAIAEDDLIRNPRFVGKRGAAPVGVTPGTVPDNWRAIATGGGVGEVEIVPLLADELYPGSPETNAVTWRHGVGSVGNGDAGLDKDVETLREPIAEEVRVYKSLVDVRNGGPYGGAPHFFSSLQFGNDDKIRTHGFAPSADFETMGLTESSTTNGLLSVRLDVGPAIGSVHLDDVRVYDVTEENRVVNGGFENSDTRVLDWRSVFVAGAEGSITLDNDAYSGNNAVRFERTNADGVAQLDTDESTLRIATTGGETVQIQFAAKKISGASNARLTVTMAMFNDAGAYIGNVYFEGVNPGTSDYELFFSPGILTHPDARYLTVVFNIRNSSNLGNPIIGAYLIDDVVLSTKNGFTHPEGQLFENGDFENNPFGGTFGTDGSFNIVDDISIPAWRFVGVGGASGTALQNAASSNGGAVGLELVQNTHPVGGDIALDKDTGLARARIPLSPAVYRIVADVRDGGQHGGTDYFSLSPQFPDGSRARIFTVDPSASFETIGSTTRWDNSGQLGVRLDLGDQPNRSVYCDNVFADDVTYGVDRMINGGFENSSTRILNWRFVAVAGATGSATLDSDARSGSNAALLTRTNTDGFLSLDLDESNARIATLGGETVTVEFSSKKVSGTGSLLLLSVAAFDATGTFVSNNYINAFDPITGAYSDYSTGPIPLNDNIAFITVGFRVVDAGVAEAVGSYLIDDVTVVAEEPAANELTNILTNGDFEDDPNGTMLTGNDFADTATINAWRAFAVSGAGATYTVTSAAATSGLVGMELSRDEGLVGDRVFDNDVDRFEIKPGLLYEPSFYVKTGNADDSPQTFEFDVPLLECSYLPDHPSLTPGLVATSTWQRIDIPAFSSLDAVDGHLAWRITKDGGEDAIMIALPSVIGTGILGDMNGDGWVDAGDAPLMSACLSGPNQSPSGSQFCSCLDTDDDGDVDLYDYAAIMTQVMGN